jgi:hypothetical protein
MRHEVRHPPLPYLAESASRAGFAKNGRQKLDVKELQDQNLENKILFMRGLTLWALHPLRSMIAQLAGERQGWMSHDWRLGLWEKRTGAQKNASFPSSSKRAERV